MPRPARPNLGRQTPAEVANRIRSTIACTRQRDAIAVVVLPNFDVAWGRRTPSGKNMTVAAKTLQQPDAVERLVGVYYPRRYDPSDLREDLTEWLRLNPPPTS